MVLALGLRAMFAEEGFDAVGEVGGLVTVNVDDERRTLWIAVVDGSSLEAAVIPIADTRSVGDTLVCSPVKLQLVPGNGKYTHMR